MINLLTNINIQFYLLAYFIGGIPFGYLIVRFFYGINIQEVGSGSIGATNVLRVLKEVDPKRAKSVAILTILLDALKGAVLILIAKMLEVSADTQWSIAVLSVMGHCFSPYLKFEGGKGVATGFGVMAVLLPIEAFSGLFIWFITGKFLKISSLSSLLGLLTFVLVSYFIHPNIPVIDTHFPLFVIAFFIIYKHLPNILRLLEGKEGKVI